MQFTYLPFINQPPALRGWRIFFLALSFLFLIIAIRQWTAQKKVVLMLEKQLSQAQPRIRIKPAQSEAQQREMGVQVQVIQEAVRQLNMPIGELIKTLQPPKDIAVALVSLDVSGKGSRIGGNSESISGILKIAAEAKTPQDMLNYVAFLTDQKLLSSVYLTKHEINSLSLENPYRFQLEALWK